MNKGLYTLLNFFLGLTAAVSLLQGIVRLVAGPPVFLQASFMNWFLMATLVSLAGAVLLIRYYHYRQFRFAFIAAIISTLAAVGYAVLIYLMIVTQQAINYNLPVYLFSVGAGIVYAVSLLFTDTRKGSWLKIAGAFMLVIYVLSLATLIPAFYPGASPYVYDKIGAWTSLAATFTPILLILHFREEISALNTENTGKPTRSYFEKAMGTVLVLTGALTFISGILLANESFSNVYWGQLNFEKTKTLARLFEARTFVNSKGDTLFYRILRPLDYDSTKQYPLVVSLPYGGQPATDKIRQIEGAVAAEMLSTDVYRKLYPSFIFIPNCPAGSGWGGIPNYPSVDSLTLDAILSLDEQFSIDTKRRYVTGLSRGGYGTWNFICKRPDMFAAAIPVCGAGNPALASRIVDVPVWAFHGLHDHNVPVSGSRDMINAIKAAGGHPIYTEFPDEGHNIWYQVSVTPGVMEWLFTQKRE